MPRNGSGVYTLPAGTAATTLTTIDSSKYNAFTADLEQDLNTDRPIAAGGTGSSTASGARENLGVYGKTFRIDTTSRSAGASDNNQLIEFTAAGTLSTDAAATLADGWRCYVYASGGIITIDPNSSETVNGQETITVPKGQHGVLAVNDGNFTFVFMAPSPVQFVKLGTPQVISSGVSSVVFADIPADLKKLVIIGEGIVTNAAATNDTLAWQASTDNGSTWASSANNYWMGTTGSTSFGVTNVSGDTSEAKDGRLEVEFRGVGNSAHRTNMVRMGIWYGVAANNLVVNDPTMANVRAVAETDNAIRCIPGIGTQITAGTFTAYEVR